MFLLSIGITFHRALWQEVIYEKHLLPQGERMAEKTLIFTYNLLASSNLYLTLAF